MIATLIGIGALALVIGYWFLPSRLHLPFECPICRRGAETPLSYTNKCICGHPR